MLSTVVNCKTTEQWMNKFSSSGNDTSAQNQCKKNTKKKKWLRKYCSWDWELFDCFMTYRIHYKHYTGELISTIHDTFKLKLTWKCPNSNMKNHNERIEWKTLESFRVYIYAVFNVHVQKYSHQRSRWTM